MTMTAGRQTAGTRTKITHTASDIFSWSMITGMMGILIFLAVWAVTGTLEKVTRVAQWVQVTVVSIALFILLCCGPLAAKGLSRLEPLGSLILISYAIGWFHVLYAIAYHYMHSFNYETGFRRWIHAFVEGAVIPPWFMFMNDDDDSDGDDIYFSPLYKDIQCNVFHEESHASSNEDENEEAKGDRSYVHLDDDGRIPRFLPS